MVTLCNARSLALWWIIYKASAEPQCLAAFIYVSSVVLFLMDKPRVVIVEADQPKVIHIQKRVSEFKIARYG